MQEKRVQKAGTTPTPQRNAKHVQNPETLTINGKGVPYQGMGVAFQGVGFPFQGVGVPRQDVGVGVPSQVVRVPIQGLEVSYQAGVLSGCGSNLLGIVTEL